MTDSYDFLKQVLDTIPEHTIVIDKEGEILFVNRSWLSFGGNKENVIKGDWNYLKLCDEAAASGDDLGSKAASGIRKVINSEKLEFYFEYPSHGPDEKRWFMMRVTSFTSKEQPYFVISHQNITVRKLAEEKALSLSRIDDLTNISNRRYFDEFLNSEWNRCSRAKMPVSLALINVDHFKLLNHSHGNQVGDECLKTIGSTLEKFAQRSGDLCARFGGDEFAIIYGNTSLQVSRQLIDRLNNEIQLLKIPNEQAPTLTVSIGLATMFPDKKNRPEELIKAADKLVNTARNKGGNLILAK